MSNFKQLLKRAASALLALLLLAALVPGSVWADVDYEEEDYEWNGETRTALVYKCPECGDGIRIIHEDGGDPNPDLFDNFYCGECGFCWDCAREKTHCPDCGKCLADDTPVMDYCIVCHRCSGCRDFDDHCALCYLHTEEKCTQCSFDACYVCHDEQNAWCDFCGACLVAANENGAICVDWKHHCYECCLVCDGCGHCFATESQSAPSDVFCEECFLCIDCAVESEKHCSQCENCFADHPRCEAADSPLCTECCWEAGNHCKECGQHVGVDGDWCPTDPKAHCLECAELCDGCGECFICKEIEPCEDCGMCEDCCLEFSEEAGCECGLCVESSDFADEAHRCARCEAAFSCVEEFCDLCGLCLDCCLAASEDAGCVCGLCVEDSEFEDEAEHLCSNCGGFTCVNGEICDFCGYCEECCLEASYDAGCVCGLCVEDPAFSEPEHLCEMCEANFSCATPFCGDCGYCIDCCHSESEQMGCTHEVCVQSSAWQEHYCELCECCKVDCDCGQDCCVIGADSYERSYAAVLGSILSQPRNVGAYVSDGSNDDYLHTNRVVFGVSVFGDPNELYYQWYRKDGVNGTPEKLTDLSAGDEEYWGRNDAITSGAATATLQTYVPADACVKEYYYYCEITDRDGNLLSTTREAKLRARHRFAWVSTGAGGHIYRCVGCGALGKFADEVREHEFTERQILIYPTETQPGLLGNVCQTCGYQTGEELAPLGKHERHEFHYYSTAREHWCECFCGRRINARSEHSWGDWVLDQAATEKSRGAKHHVCLVCGYREDAVIEKKRHAHGAFYTGDPYYHSFHSKNARQHGRICDDPECGQWYDLENHSFGEWEIAQYPDWDADGSMERVCTGCGYTQVKRIPKWGNDRKRILTVLNGKATRTTTLCSGKDNPVLTAEDRPGYVFEGWQCEIVWQGQGEETWHRTDVTLLTPYQAGYSGKTDVIQVDDPSAEVMTVLKMPRNLNELLPLSYSHSYDYQVELKGKCYFVFTAQYAHIPVRARVWPEDSCRWEDRVLVSAGEGYDCSTGTVRSARLGTHLFLEEIETGDPGVGYPYEYVLHLNGYEGGPIELLSPDGDSQMRYNVLISIEDTESVIRSYAGKDFGLRVNELNGGELTLTSENGGKLTIEVEGKGLDVCGLEVTDAVGRSSVFFNHADLEIVSTNLSEPSTLVEQSAQGICAGDVRIVGGALSIEAHAPELANRLAAVGINAENSIDIDSPVLRIDVTDVDAGTEGAGVGLNAKSVEISMLTAKLLSTWFSDGGLMDEGDDEAAYSAGVFIDFPANGVGVALPREDPAGIEAITTYGENENGEKTYAHRLGYTVQIDYDPDKLTLSPVGRVYVDEKGRFCVPAGEALEFVAAAEPGCRGNNIGLYRDGKTFLLPTVDGDENRRYRIESVTECMVLQLGGVQPVDPFASEPLPSVQTALGGGLGTAAVTWEMNAYEVQKLYRKNNGSQAANGVLDRHGAGEVLRTDTAYSAGVWLQSYSSVTDRWINRPELGTFDARIHSFAEFTETRQYSQPGTTTTYRLALLFDGIHYYSEPFEVSWTADASEVSARAASAVELYMTNAWNSNPNSDATIYDGYDSGAWLRLDARYPDIYYDIVNGLYVNSFDRTKARPTEAEGYIRFAHFDAGKGLLTLDGETSGSWVSDKYGSYSYYLSGDLHEIRTAEDSRGDLTVYAAGESCAIYQDTASVGWIDQWGDGTLVHFADSAAILNETGSVLLTGESGAELYINAVGPYDMVREQRADGSYYYTGERIAAVRAAGDIRADGAFTLTIFADCNKDWEETPGYYGCAVGLDAKGDIVIGGETVLHANIGYGGNPAGSAQALYAAGHIRMEDDCAVDLWTNGVRSQSRYCNDRASIWAEKTVTVDGQASLTVYSFGEELCSIYAAEGVYVTSGRKAALNAIPSSDGIVSSAIISPRTVVSGFHSFTWKDPDSLSPIHGEMAYGDANTYVTYLSEPDDWDGSRTLTVMDGLPRALALITQGLSTDTTKIDITRNGDTAAVFGREFAVCPGDTVTLYPPEGLPGSEFERWGWPQYGPRDIKVLDGGAITFTMPDWDLTPIALFDTSVVSGFTFTLDGSDPAMTADHRIGKAEIGFRVEIPAELAPGTQLDAYAVLECTYENAEGELVWADRDTEPANRYSYLNHDAVVYNAGLASFNVDATLYLADIVPVDKTPGEWVRIYESPDRSYRLRIVLYTADGSGRYSEWCCLTTNPFELSWDKPFTVDVDGAGRNPEIVIPSGDVGTSFALDFSKYVSGGSGQYHYSIVPAPEPVPMEFTFNEDRGTFCFFHTENSLGMNYQNNSVQITDVVTGELALIYFDVMPTLDTKLYDTWVGGVHVSDYNRADVLGDGRVSYTPATDTESAKLTLNGVTLTSGFCGRRDPAVNGNNAFAAIFTREDLEIVAEDSNLIALDENCEASGDPYVQDALIAGIYGFGANVTLRGSGELHIKSRHGFCLAEDAGQHGGSFTLADGALTLYVDKGNLFGKYGSEGFTYAGGRFTAFSAETSETPLLNGLSFADGFREKTVLLLSAKADRTKAQPGTPLTLANQQPGELYHYIRIQPADSMEADPTVSALVNGESGEIAVTVNKSVKGVSVMQAIVAVYDKATGRFLELWMGEISPTEPLVGTGLRYDPSKDYRIMVLDGDTWQPLADSGSL